MKSIFLLLSVLMASSPSFAEGQRSFSSEAMYCDYTNGGDCASIESGKIEVTKKANSICAPQIAVIVSDWIDFDQNISPFRPASWVKATFICAESQLENTICKKIGSSYAVKCCDNSGDCWIE